MSNIIGKNDSNLKTLSEHWHIDNGGYTLRCVYGIASGQKEAMGLTVENGFFGYSTNKMSLHSLDSKKLREMAIFLNKAADLMEGAKENS
jgi:hypothetical protein